MSEVGRWDKIGTQQYNHQWNALTTLDCFVVECMQVTVSCGGNMVLLLTEQRMMVDGRKASFLIRRGVAHL